MDRLALIKALADPSRYAVYEELAGAERPLSTGELAEQLDLHPNTVRLHLEKLREAGLIESSPDRHGSVGRPHLMWSLRYTSPSFGLEPDSFRVLAHLLADLAAGDPDSASRAVAVGRRRGLEQARNHPLDRPGEPRSAPLRRADTDEAPAGIAALGAAERAAACLRSVVEELAELGFDPVLEQPDRPEDDRRPETPDRPERPRPAGPTSRDLSPRPADRGSAVVAFTRCPFRELAVLYPELVCRLHRGITEGILTEVAGRTGAGPVAIESFATLVDPDPCRAGISISA